MMQTNTNFKTDQRQWNRRRSRKALLPWIATIAVALHSVDAFHSYHHLQTSQLLSQHSTKNVYSQRAAAKGFGGGSGGGFAASSSSIKKKGKKKGTTSSSSSSTAPSIQSLLKQVEKKYGGSSPQEIARGTQILIDQSIQQLPQHLQLALQLYRQQFDWNRRIAGMDVLAQSQLPPQMVAQAQRAQKAFDAIMKDHSLTQQDLQKTMQEITWDASADAKAVKSLTGTMPRVVQNRVQRACDYAAEAVKNSDKAFAGVLDVGCGYGVLVPFLKKAGIAPSQICGMDLSSEMVKNAQSFYPDVRFEVNNFLELPPNKDRYNAVVFCSSLHDLPDMRQALEKACALLTAKGRLVIVHPQGASHVAQQHKSNPVLVPRGLPTAAELEEWLCGNDDDSDSKMELAMAPAEAKSQQEIKEGYLAVLTKL